MTENEKKVSERDRRRRRKYRLTISILMVLLLATLFIVQCQLSNLKSEMLAEREAMLDSITAYDNHRLDSLQRYTDSLEAARADSIQRYNDSLANAQPKKELSPEEKARLDSIAKRRQEIRDSLAREKKALEDSLKLARKAIADSIARSDSIRKADSIAYANRDSIPPEASIVPPEGRYYEPIQLKVKCDEYKCKTYYSVGDTSHIQELTKAVEYNKTGDVYYLAEDSAGNRTAWQKVHYDMASDNVCGKNAYPVPVNGKTVCVDAYEYPNAPDAVVKDMVSHEQAKALCEGAGKRLCKFDEWTAACKGKDGFRYSYGSTYKPSKCNTNSSKARRAGRKEQCRSWYGMYDMNGNLWEWTDTPSKEAPNRFLVAGGAWDTQNQSQCTDTKYSFYPQNQYAFVGFRCCADAK